MNPAAETIARAVLESYAPVYIACGHLAHVARERAVNEAARAVERHLEAYRAEVLRNFATNCT